MVLLKVGNNMEISKRLEWIASYVQPGDRVADIGTDHGYIPIYLAQNNISPKVIAMDINFGPLEKAKNNIAAYHQEDKVEVRLSNGLMTLDEDEVDCVIICGMGGRLIDQILRESKEKLHTYKRWIISPHKDIEIVRKTLLELGVAIIDEDMIYEDGHYYTLISAITDTKDVAYLPYSPNENPLYFVYGKCLVTKKHPLLMEQLEMKNTRDTQLIFILKEKGIINRIAELEHDIAIRKKVIKWMQ